MNSDSIRNSQTLCAYPGCIKTVWQDPDGSYSQFCGKGHRDAMAVNNSETQVCRVNISRLSHEYHSEDTAFLTALQKSTSIHPRQQRHVARLRSGAPTILVDVIVIHRKYTIFAERHALQLIEIKNNPHRGMFHWHPSPVLAEGKFAPWQVAQSLSS